MTLSLITFVRLVASILLPVIVSVVIYVLDKKTKFGKIRYMPKQIIIGISFGLVAISATEYGVPLDGAVLNVRSASPLSAGLIFGAPAGIISGTDAGCFEPKKSATRAEAAVMLYRFMNSFNNIPELQWSDPDKSSWQSHH